MYPIGGEAILAAQDENVVVKGGEANATNSAKKPKKNKAVIVIIILLLVLIVIGGILIYIMLRDRQPTPEEDRDLVGGRGIVATEDNFETLFDEFTKPVDDSQLIVNMSVRLQFETWKKSTRNTYVKNDAANLRTIYFDLFLDDVNGDRGDLIYSSPYIPVGKELRDFSLNQELSAGEYTATVVYYLVDDEYEVITDVVLGVKLIIRE